MKLNSLSYSVLSVIFFLTTEIHAGIMGPAEPSSNEKIYFSVFGGGGSSNHLSINQYGTAFFTENGPLAVNAFGQSNRRNVGFVGGNIGYLWKDRLFNSFNNQASLSPAIELEGYSIGKSSLTGHDINNDTTRLPEHDFLNTYPMSAGVFLANIVLNFNVANYAKFQPYVGAGFGAAVLSISNANSLQTSPLEQGVNHYNSNPNDKSASFAAQSKVGLNFSFNEHLSIFAEYRWLYITNTHFLFGSTMYPTHVPTSSWTANLGDQYYNMGAGGIRVKI